MHKSHLLVSFGAVSSLAAVTLYSLASSLHSNKTFNVLVASSSMEYVLSSDSKTSAEIALFQCSVFSVLNHSSFNSRSLLFPVLNNR